MVLAPHLPTPDPIRELKAKEAGKEVKDGPPFPALSPSLRDREREIPPLPLCGGGRLERGFLLHRHRVNGCFLPEGVGVEGTPSTKRNFSPLYFLTDLIR